MDHEQMTAWDLILRKSISKSKGLMVNHLINMLYMYIILKKVEASMINNNLFTAPRQVTNALPNNSPAQYNTVQI